MISEETKRLMRELEGQKITLEDEIERLAYANNLVRIKILEEEVFEIEDTLKKLRSNHWFEDISREELQREESTLQ